MIHEASWRGLFNFIIWFFAISFILRLIARLAAPYVVRKAQEQMRNQMNEQAFHHEHKTRQEGDVRVEKNPKARQEEYTDYVEIKDELE